MLHAQQGLAEVSCGVGARSRAALPPCRGRPLHVADEHLLLEESTIFPVIRDFLSKEAQRSIVDELRARRSSSALAIVNTEAKP